MATKFLSFRTPFTSRVAVTIKCEDKSLAQQNFKDEVDINHLLEKFKVTGQIPQGVRLPTYGDFSGVTDYQTAMNALLTARDSFMQLPAQIRSDFGNDPQKFLEYCSDPKNADDLVKRGLAARPPETTVQAIHSLAKQMGVAGASAPAAAAAASGEAAKS